MKTLFLIISFAVSGIAQAQNCFQIEHPVNPYFDSIYCSPYTFSKGIYRIPYETLIKVWVLADHITNNFRPGQVSFSAHFLNPDEGHNVVAAADGWVRKYTSGIGYSSVVWMEHPNGEWTMYDGIGLYGILQLDSFVTAGTVIGFEMNQSMNPYSEDYDMEFAVIVPVDSNGLVFYELPDYSEILDYDYAEKRVPLFCDITGHIAAANEIYTALGCSETCETFLPIIPATFEAGDFNAFIGEESLTTDADLTFEPASSVVIQSSSSVTLKPGFYAKESSYFEGRIGECSGANLNKVIPEANNKEEVASSVSIYPNPASKTATISWLMNEDAGVKITVCDIEKRELIPTISSEQMKAGAHQQTIDVSSLPPGMYLVILQMNQSGEIQKLVVQR